MNVRHTHGIGKARFVDVEAAGGVVVSSQVESGFAGVASNAAKAGAESGTFKVNIFPWFL